MDCNAQAVKAFANVGAFEVVDVVERVDSYSSEVVVRQLAWLVSVAVAKARTRVDAKKNKILLTFFGLGSYEDQAWELKKM